MQRKQHTARSLRRAARAARCVAGDDVAVAVLIRALAAPLAPVSAEREALRVGPLSARLAAEHGLRLDELLALGPDELIDLFWPDQPARAVGAGASRF